jgi:hypothetical protein
MVAEARILAKEGVGLAWRYLEYHVANCGASLVEDFIRDVILGNKDAATWGIVDVICYLDLDVGDGRAVFSTSTDAVITVLESVPGEHWWRTIPTTRDDHVSCTGAPGVLVRAAPYWWKAPERANYVLIREQRSMEPISRDDLPIAVRRWIASRLAWKVNKTAYFASGTPSIDGLLAALKVSDAELSADARIAARALVREQALESYDQDRAPGFRGPDDWYT